MPICTSGKTWIIRNHWRSQGYNSKVADIKQSGSSKAALIPINLSSQIQPAQENVGRSGQLSVPDIDDLLATKAHARVEMVVQKYTNNAPGIVENRNRTV